VYKRRTLSHKGNLTLRNLKERNAMSDTPNGETVNAGDSQTTVQTPATPAVAPATPQVNAGDPAEVERLRKENEQKDLRVRQLENERAAREKADEEAKAKALEEQNQFKDLYEQEKAKREAAEAEAEKTQRESELKKARADVLAEYNEDVRALAEEVGIDLTDTDDSAVASFKEKLDKINTRVATTGTVGPNNRQANNDKTELSGDDLKVALREEKSFHDLVVDRYPGIASMTGKS
jgi:ABC-type proline/glycine betaine transport system ATPase subunit